MLFTVKQAPIQVKQNKCKNRLPLAQMQLMLTQQELRVPISCSGRKWCQLLLTNVSLLCVFSGNKETLLTKPQEQGIDTRQELLKFHAKNYSANIMTLAVLGKGTLYFLMFSIRLVCCPLAIFCCGVTLAHKCRSRVKEWAGHSERELMIDSKFWRDCCVEVGSAIGMACSCCTHSVKTNCFRSIRWFVSLSESLDELSDLVIPLFGGVENKSLEVPSWPEHPYGPNEVKVGHQFLVYSLLKIKHSSCRFLFSQIRWKPTCLCSRQQCRN